MTDHRLWSRPDAVRESKPGTSAGAGADAGAGAVALLAAATALGPGDESNDSCVVLLPKLRSFRPDGARSSGDGGGGLPVLASLGESATAPVSESRRFSKKRTDRFSARTGAVDEDDKEEAAGKDALG